MSPHDSKTARGKRQEVSLRSGPQWSAGDSAAGHGGEQEALHGIVSLRAQEKALKAIACGEMGAGNREVILRSPACALSRSTTTSHSTLALTLARIRKRFLLADFRVVAIEANPKLSPASRTKSTTGASS
jgi:hypothetical protein